MALWLLHVVALARRGDQQLGDHFLGDVTVLDELSEAPLLRVLDPLAELR
jgi:hypothetical protein